MRRFVVIASVVLLVLVVAGVAVSRFSLTALDEPGRAEIYLVTQAKHRFVARDSRGVPPEPAATPASAAAGEKLYGAECAMCHGLNARTPTDAGRWMYPRAADLTSQSVQQYSDRELFWILKNGIRLSGMPAFGRVETDEHIWQLVHYVRTLNQSAKPSGSPQPKSRP
jgi:mono/diheme cytochrome c family protein